MPKRTLSPYEQTHLARFGFANVDIAQYGEMPVEYITGHVEFHGHIFEITKNTLIPRIETEELVALALEKIQELSKTKPSLVIADVGTGCGAIGISVFLALPMEIRLNSIFYLSEISASALEVAHQNSQELIGDAKALHFLHSDLLSNYPPAIMFDLIIANLPYIPTERIAVLDESVKDYEPRVALDGGPDGLTLIRKLIPQVEERLNPGGMILLEVDYTHDASFLRQQLPIDHFNLDLQVREDSFHRTRFAVLTKK